MESTGSSSLVGQSASSGTSSGTRDYLRVYFGSDITTGTMYGTMSTYYNSVHDFAENLEDFPEFGGGEQLRYQAPRPPGPESPAPASFTAPPQNQAFTAPPAIQPPWPVEGGEEETGTLDTVWHYAWEYGLEVVPVAAPTRGFVRAYNEGSTLGMGLSAVELGLDLSGIGPVARGGKFTIEGTFRGIGKVASEVKPLASGALDVAKAKAGG